MRIARERPEILDCHRVIGEFSFIVRAFVRDVAHLEQVLNLEPRVQTNRNAAGALHRV
jgi:DNA-binding Lrp family transcriptional regulator